MPSFRPLDTLTSPRASDCAAVQPRAIRFSLAERSSLCLTPSAAQQRPPTPTDDPGMLYPVYRSRVTISSLPGPSPSSSASTLPLALAPRPSQASIPSSSSILDYAYSLALSLDIARSSRLAHSRHLERVRAFLSQERLRREAERGDGLHARARRRLQIEEDVASERRWIEAETVAREANRQLERAKRAEARVLVHALAVERRAAEAHGEDVSAEAEAQVRGEAAGLLAMADALAQSRWEHARVVGGLKEREDREEKEEAVGGGGGGRGGERIHVRRPLYDPVSAVTVWRARDRKDRRRRPTVSLPALLPPPPSGSSTSPQPSTRRVPSPHRVRPTRRTAAPRLLLYGSSPPPVLPRLLSAVHRADVAPPAEGKDAEQHAKHLRVDELRQLETHRGRSGRSMAMMIEAQAGEEEGEGELEARRRAEEERRRMAERIVRKVMERRESDHGEEADDDEDEDGQRRRWAEEDRQAEDAALQRLRTETESATVAALRHHLPPDRRRAADTRVALAQPVRGRRARRTAAASAGKEEGRGEEQKDEGRLSVVIDADLNIHYVAAPRPSSSSLSAPSPAVREDDVLSPLSPTADRRATVYSRASFSHRASTLLSPMSRAVTVPNFLPPATSLSLWQQPELMRELRSQRQHQHTGLRRQRQDPLAEPGLCAMREEQLTRKERSARLRLLSLPPSTSSLRASTPSRRSEVLSLVMDESLRRGEEARRQDDRELDRWYDAPVHPARYAEAEMRDAEEDRALREWVNANPLLQQWTAAREGWRAERGRREREEEQRRRHEVELDRRKRKDKRRRQRQTAVEDGANFVVALPSP